MTEYELHLDPICHNNSKFESILKINKAIFSNFQLLFTVHCVEIHIKYFFSRQYNIEVVSQSIKCCVAFIFMDLIKLFIYSGL